MTEYVKLFIIAQVAIAILVLPSSALCNCSNEDCECAPFSSQYKAQPSYEHCTPFRNDDFYDVGGDDSDGTVHENSPVSYCFPPVAYDSNMTITEDTPVEIILNATDPDGNLMTYSISSSPSDGSLGIITGNKVVYTPDANYTGVDSFSFRAHDGIWDSNIATVTISVEPDCSPHLSHAFYGNVTIDGEPAPESTIIMAVGAGIRSDISGNPVATKKDGSYGSADEPDQNLVVKGCIEDGTPITFYADGVQAEVWNVNTGGPWQSAYPYSAGEVTDLNIRVTPPIPPPDNVYVNAISVTISNATYGFFQTVMVEKQPWIELKVTRGVFDIQISATGFHDFSDQPVLGRDATLGIYENGNPVSPEINVAFGSRTARYEYVATETRTFDILIHVNERPEINDVKHITIYAVSGSDSNNSSAPAGPGGTISPAGPVSVDGGAAHKLDSLSFRTPDR